MTAPIEANKSAPAPPTKSVGSFAMNPNILMNHKIKVAIRMRPLLEDTTDSENIKKGKKTDKRAWNLEKTGPFDTLTQKGTARKVDGKTVFNFDTIFNEDTQTPLVYKSIARPMVQSVLDGKHATIFAYGQTGSGKTFTMQGDGKAQSGQAGITQLVASDLFRFTRMGIRSKRDYVIKVCYVEVYNERIRDLLSDDVGSTASHGTSSPEASVLTSSSQPEVTIRTSGSGEVILNCTQIEVQSVDEVLELLITGNTQRVVAKTDMNNHSSRSHAVFRLTVHSSLESSEEVVRVSDFNLVDLAGSESVKISNTNGTRLREGAKINQSLLSLSRVIHNLSLPEKKRPKHINYRDSKLTRILQPHLSGNAEMAILCCTSPSKAFVEETRSTLKFASRAKLVHMKPKVNEVLDDSALMKKLEHELANSRREIDDLKNQLKQVSQAQSPLEHRPQSVQSVQSMTSQDSVDYGYEDMDAGPGVGGGNRPYVMPKNHDLSNSPGEDIIVAPNKFPSRAYVMPKNHEVESTSDMGNYLKQMGEQDETDLNDSAHFKLDSVDPLAAERKINKYLQGRIESDDEDDPFGMSQDGGFSQEDSADGSRDDFERSGRSGGGYEDNFDRSGRSATHYGSKDEYDRSGRSVYQSVESPRGVPGTYRLYGTPDKRNETTLPTEDESYDGPTRSYPDVSLKFGSVKSTPETMQSIQKGSTDDTLDSAADHELDDKRMNNTISWDTMDLNAMRPGHVGQPIRALKSLYNPDAPIPEEITIICAPVVEGRETICITDKLKDSQERSAFLDDKLEMADDLVEAVFKDLDRARLCIHDLVYRNVQLATKLKEKKRENIKKEYNEGEVAVEQYWLLKGAMYVGLFFFITGGYEFFMASVILIWLILEANLSPS